MVATAAKVHYQLPDAGLRPWYFQQMIIQSVHFTFSQENAEKSEAMLRELRDASRKEEGVISFEVARSQEKPNVFALWEVYRDRAALDTHRATEHFKRFVLNGVRQLAQDRTAETVFPI